RMSSKVAEGGLAYARHRGADRIFCGHTHQAVHVEKDGVHYYNSGGWVDSKLTYLTIDEEGVRIHDYREHDYIEHGDREHGAESASREHEGVERADDRDSGEERSEVDSSAADFADDRSEERRVGKECRSRWS